MKKGKHKNTRGLKTAPPCIVCNKEMFPDVFRFRGMCAKCTQVHKIMSRNLAHTELILRLIYNEKGDGNGQ